MPSRILAIDIQLHFYICRCFLPVSSSDMIRNANLGYYKLEFLKSILTGQSPANFCFKSMWPRTTPTFLTLLDPEPAKIPRMSQGTSAGACTPPCAATCLPETEFSIHFSGPKREDSLLKLQPRPTTVDYY